MSYAVEIDDVLELVAENGKPFDVIFVDEGGALEDFTGVDAATLTIREMLDVAAPVLVSRDTTQLNLVLVPAESVLRCNRPTVPELLLLPAGTYVGEAAVRKAGLWLHSDPFAVRIVRSMAPEIP